MCRRCGGGCSTRWRTAGAQGRTCPRRRARRYPHCHLRALWRALWPPILHLCANQQPGASPGHRWGLAKLHGTACVILCGPDDGVPTAKTQKSRETRLVRRRRACWSQNKVEPSTVSARDVVARGVSEWGGPRTEVVGLVSCPVSILSAISLVSGIRSLTGTVVPVDTRG